MFNFKRTILVTGLIIAALSIAACGRDEEPTPAPAAVEQLPSQELATATPAPAGDTANTETTSTESTTTETTTTETTTETTSESTTSETTGTSNVVAPSSGNPAIDAVASALRNQMANLPMRVTMLAGATAGGTIEIASPTSMRMNMGGLQMMFVDGKAYTYENGVWTENPAMSGMVEIMAGQFNPGAIQEQIDTIVSAEQLPDETINGQAVSVYQFTVNPEIAGEEGVSKVYVSKADNLPVRVSNDGSGEDAYSVDYEYDPSIVIEAPQ